MKSFDRPLRQVYVPKSYLFSGRGEIPHRRYPEISSSGSPRALQKSDLEVSRSGERPEPTVIVRMGENMLGSVERFALAVRVAVAGSCSVMAECFREPGALLKLKIWGTANCRDKACIVSYASFDLKIEVLTSHSRALMPGA